MGELKCLIVDDEKHGRENLRQILNSYCEGVVVAGEASSADEAEDIVKIIKPDIVFLDILMPGKNGFDFLDLFQERKFAVIFVTASYDFGIQAVKAGVLDYILKPVNIFELQEAIEKARNYLNNGGRSEAGEPPQRLILPDANGFNIQQVDHIMMLQADSNYSIVYNSEGKRFCITRHLKDFEKHLPANLFVRTHRSYILNIKYLRNYDNFLNGYAILKNGMKIPVSKRKEKDFAAFVRRSAIFS